MGWIIAGVVVAVILMACLKAASDYDDERRDDEI